MAEYIPKSAVVAEIDRRIQELRPTNTHQMQVGGKIDRDVLMWLNALTWVKKILDTLEVKEVDLENSVKGRIDYPFISVDFPNIYLNYKELKDYCYKNDIKDEDEVKIILIND